jgi:hypothetical protein
MLGAEPQNYTMANDSGKTTIPFRWIGNHIVVPVLINNSKTLNMVLDTGSPSDIISIFGSSIVGKVESGQEILVKSPGGAPIPAKLAQFPAKIGDVSFESQNALILPDSFAARFSGKDGIIGMTLFSRFVVAIDFDRLQITLTEPEKFNYTGKGISVPLTWDPFPIVECSAVLEDGSLVPLRVIVDTGNSRTLKLNVSSDEKISVPKNSYKSIIARMVSQDLYGSIGRIKTLQIAGFKLENVVTAFQDEESPEILRKERNGNLGASIVARFNTIFDYPNSRMILEPNSHFSDPFEYNMAGMMVFKSANGTFRIDYIVPNSPADEVGLKTGQEIVEINGTEAREVDLNEFDQLMLTEGKNLKLKVNQDGKLVEINLKTRRLI